ncbi:MAG: NAD(P)-dependent oxidoreductase [Brachybacterium sp.]|nr:NAD(P)-dependent oxidoreductase [Brachybacterium sp.]
MSTAPTVGWVGLGAMGAPMALVTARAGIPVTAFDMNPAALEAVAPDVTAAATPVDAVRNADVVVIMVATGAQLDQVLFGEAGIAPHLGPETVVMVMATVGPVAVDRTVELLREVTTRVVDAPVSGGTARAATGDLLVMVSGTEADVETVRPLLDAMAAHAPLVGPAPGDGQRMKIVNQLLCGVHIAAAGEALALADGMGLDIRQVHEVLGTGAAASFMFADRGARMVDGSFDDPKSALDIFVKDMGLVTEAAGEASRPVPLAETAAALYRRGSEDGLGRKDDSIVYRLLGGT